MEFKYKTILVKTPFEIHAQSPMNFWKPLCVGMYVCVNYKAIKYYKNHIVH